MATNAPTTRCMICNRLDTYRVADDQPYRRPGGPMVFGPTNWEWVPHEHTQAEIEAWGERIGLVRKDPLWVWA